MKRILSMAACAAVLFLGVPVSAQQAQGGSTQAGAQPGCMNQWMFNGVWRMRVTKVEWHPADSPTPPGATAWLVTMQWNNGTSYAGIAPADTLKQDLVLGLQNGDTVSTADSTTGAMSQQQLDFHTFPASGQFTYSQLFVGNNLDPNNKPVKLLVTFDVAKYKQSHPQNSGKFWKLKTPGYNYRIDLTCNK